jgi:DNA-binding NtrC family response regulator
MLIIQDRLSPHGQKKIKTLNLVTVTLPLMRDPVIFIVDTNPVHGNLVKYHLTINRFTNVWLFTSVEECLYRLRKQSPDFLVSEYDLGRYNGLELLRMAGKISQGTRVVFFTSVEDAGIAHSLLAEGALDYIVKTSRLEASISELIRNLVFLKSQPVTEKP